jgi:hypothetical protein
MLSRRSEDLLKNAVKKYLSFFGYVRVSPNKLQRELNLSRRRFCGGDQSGAGDGISSLIEDSEVSSGRGEISPVQEIEKFRAELDIDVFRKPVDGVVLEYRSIQFRSPGSDQSIASEIASEVRRLSTAFRNYRNVWQGTTKTRRHKESRRQRLFDAGFAERSVQSLHFAP